LNFFDGTQHIQNDVQNLMNVVEDCTYNVEILNSEFDEQCTHLKSNFRIVDRERLFDEESARLFDEIMEQAMETLTALEIKQELLLKKNMLLNEKLVIVRECKTLEENAKKKAEMQLAVEENIKANGEVLTERGFDSSATKSKEKNDELTLSC